jgi:hypothetical protein
MDIVSVAIGEFAILTLGKGAANKYFLETALGKRLGNDLLMLPVIGGAPDIQPGLRAVFLILIETENLYLWAVECRE